MTNLRISLIQSALFWEDKAANLAMFSEKIMSIPDKPELILLPEMFTTGFSMNKASLGETMEGPTIAWMKKTAAEKPAILAGSMIARDPGEHAYYNRLVWMLPNGEFGYYDKRHLFAFGDEDEHYRSGNRRLIAMVKGWKVNLQICYDLRFPVWLRQHVTESSDPEYDLLVVVANWPVARSHAWKTLLQARAIENQCFVAGVNRTGTDGRGLQYGGESMIVGPLGEIIGTLESEEGIISHTLDRGMLDEVRSRFPFWRDADRFFIQS